MKIVKKQLTELKPLERNVRKHNEKQLDHFIESLRQFGQTRAFVIDDDGSILVGNGMHAAMSKMGGWDKVDCHVVSGLSERDKQKLVLSDNKVFQLGSDDYDNIEALLSEIAADGDYQVAGFDEDVLRALARSTEEVMASMDSYGVLSEEEKPAQRELPEDEPQRIDEPEDSGVVEVECDEPTQIHDSRRRVLCPHCGGVVVVDA